MLNANQNEELKIITINVNLNEEEEEKYQDYYKSMENLNDTTNQNFIHNIKEYQNVNYAMKEILTIRFIETIIVVSYSLFEEFLNIFNDKLNEIYTIPKIFVYSPDKKGIEHTKELKTIHHISALINIISLMRNFLIQLRIKRAPKSTISLLWELGMSAFHWRFFCPLVIM